MASITVPRLITAEEYAALDEVLGYRDELIEGERVLSPTPIYAHAALIDHLREILKNQLKELSPESLAVMAETGWKFRNAKSGADSIPVPDLIVLRKEDARRAIKNNGWFEGIPLLVIAVNSPSERKSRRLQKVGLYLEMGAPHVVEVDYTKRIIRVYAPEDEAATIYRAGDQLNTPFRASVDEIFSILD